MKLSWMRLPAWLRPSATGMIVFVFLIALQACLGTSSGSGMVGPGGMHETTSSRSMGWPPSVVVTSKTSADGVTRTQADVRWGLLLFAVIETYGLAMVAGHLASRKHTRRHPARILLGAIAATLALAFFAAMGVSKALWGYYLYRPSLDRRVVDATRILSVTIVDTVAGEAGKKTLVPVPGDSIAGRIAYARNDPYYSLGERALVALDDAKRLPASPPPMRTDRLARLFDMLARTGRLEAGEPGYDRAKDVRGVVIEAEGSNGKPLVFVGVQGGEVSNDHHPYYEFLFSGLDPDGEMSLLSAQRFYFDVAGIEGVEWPAFFLMFSAVGLVVTVPATLLILAIWPGRSGREPKSG